MAFEQYSLGILGKLLQSSLPKREDTAEGGNKGVWEYDLLGWFKENGLGVEMKVSDDTNIIVYTKGEDQVTLIKGRRGVETGDHSKGIFYVEVLEKDYKDEKNKWFRDGLKGNPVETHVVSVNNSGEKELIETLYPAA